jgi:hypothetical protein
MAKQRIINLNMGLEVDMFSEIPEESRLTADQVMDIWHQSVREFYSPPLNDPIIIYCKNDPSPFCIIHDKWRVKLNLAFIPNDMVLDDRDVAHWFRIAIIDHEINHYVTFPYDEEQSLKCINASMSILKDSSNPELYAKTVIYPFVSDIIVDTDLLKKIGPDIIWAMRIWVVHSLLLVGGMWSDLSKLRIRTYEIYWGTDLGVPKPLSERLEKACVKMARVMRTLDDYQEISREFSRILLPFLEKELPRVQKKKPMVSPMSYVCDKGQQGKGKGKSKGKQESGGGGKKGKEETSSKPSKNQRDEKKENGKSGNDKEKKGKDDEESEKNEGGNRSNSKPEKENERSKGKQNGEDEPRDKLVIESHDGTISEIPEDFVLLIRDNPINIKSQSNLHPDAENIKKSKEKIITEHCTELAEDLNFFGNLLNAMDIPVKRANILRYWLRGKAYGMINYDTKEMKPAGSSKHYLTEWNYDDPFSRLDIQKSYLNYPLLVPPYTKKWKYTHGSFGDMDMAIRDLLLVIDSSGSMRLHLQKNGNLSGEFYYAMQSAFALLHAAIRKEARFAVINFSTNILKTPWLKPSRADDITYAEDIIMKHQRASTSIPGGHIEELASQANNNCYITIISDSDIWNINQNLPYLQRVRQKGNIISLFLTGRSLVFSKKNPYYETLKKVCKSIYEIQKIEDLIGLVINEARDMY